MKAAGEQFRDSQKYLPQPFDKHNTEKYIHLMKIRRLLL